MSDAIAFVRTILSNPDDPVARLVLADWLDESGDSEKQVWAHYIRSHDALSRTADSDPTYQHAWRRLSSIAEQVRFRVRVPASQFIPRAELLFRLLPPLQWTLDLEGLQIPRPIIELMPESVARENVLLPLFICGSWLCFACAEPRDIDMLEKLKFILNRTVAAVQASKDQIIEAINRNYGASETESVTSVHWDMPLFTLQDYDDPSFALGRLIVEFFERQAEAMIVTPGPEVAAVQFRRGSSVLEADPISGRAYRTLLARLQELIVSGWQPQSAGVRCARVEVPTVGCRIQRYLLERKENSSGFPSITLSWIPEAVPQIVSRPQQFSETVLDLGDVTT
jgi:type IV pilus assembly protein PilB